MERALNPRHAACNLTMATSLAYATVAREPLAMLLNSARALFEHRRTLEEMPFERLALSLVLEDVFQVQAFGSGEVMEISDLTSDWISDLSSDPSSCRLPRASRSSTGAAQHQRKQPMVQQRCVNGCGSGGCTENNLCGRLYM